MISVGPDRYNPATDGMSRAELAQIGGDAVERSGSDDLSQPSWWDRFLAYRQGQA